MKCKVCGQEFAAIKLTEGACDKCYGCILERELAITELYEELEYHEPIYPQYGDTWQEVYPV